MPRATVIIATYNWATVLPYSIGSVLDQTFEDFELLVIGDGCTDESGDVVEAIDDPRVQWHNLPGNTKHQTGPNNEGLRLASGEVIAYLGHDDLWLPHHLEILLEAVDEGASIATSSWLGVPPDGRPWIWPDVVVSRSGDSSLGTAKAPPGMRSMQPTELHKMIPPSSVVHDRRLALDVGGWRLPRDTGALAPQVDLWNRMIACVGPLRRVRRITCVKIAAAARPGVYRDRPHHEQAYWLQRIRESNDPEATMRRACEEDYVFAGRAALPMPSGPPLPSGVTVSADEYLRNVRRYKGLRD